MKIRFILAVLILFSGEHSHSAQPTKSVKFLDIVFSYIESFQKYLIRKEFPVAKPTQSVTVALSTDLSDQENIFLQNRLTKVTQVLQNDFDIDVPLKIAFCCGGGGNRAMIGTFGLLSAAAQTNFLDATLYLAGVSGSTWAITAYVYQQALLAKSSQQALADLDQYFSTALSSGTHICFDNYCSMALLPSDQYDKFFQDLTQRYGYNQDISLINLYGPLIGNQSLGFLGDQALQICWSDFVNNALLGNAPLPLCAAAFDDSTGNYGYFEMSPFQAGSKDLGYIPTQYLGSKFVNLALDPQGVCPEYSLAFYLGVYGSTFAAIAQKLYMEQLSVSSKSHIKGTIDPLLFLFEPSAVKKYNSYKIWNPFGFLNKESIQSTLDAIIYLIASAEKSDIYAQFSNYNPKALGGKNNLGLFDAGVGCNFPIAALIDRPQREMDLIIMYDSNPGSTDVQTVYDYALANGISFDIRMKQLSVDELGQESMIVFNDPRSDEYVPSVTTILYFPTQGLDIQEPPYTTFNFKYEMNDVEKLNNIMHQAFISNFEIIKNIMKLLTQKYKKF